MDLTPSSEFNTDTTTDSSPTSQLTKPRHRPINRRRLLASLAGITAAFALPRNWVADAAQLPALPAQSLEAIRPASAATDPRHLAWVWQFRHDGDPAQIRDTLAAHGLGIALKTHDGVQWMSRYDTSRTAISGPRKVEEYANYFENAGVPFHAWTVSKGANPTREAERASDVLNAGARSLFMDLESHPGFWVGTRTSANQLGEEIRKRQPNARLSTSIDPRPWEVKRIPLAQFADFTDEIAPQVYWSMFSDRSNQRRYAEEGFPVPRSGVTPAFVLNATMASLANFKLPVHMIGDGTSSALDHWSEFIDGSYAVESDTVSVWRYGVAAPSLWAKLRDTPPRTVISYTVQPGDSLGRIAAQFNTTTARIVELNGITNPNLIRVGQTLRITGSGSTTTSNSAPAPAAPSSARTHRVQPGDSLLALAYRYNTTVAAIANTNGLAHPYLIRIGQVLTIP